MAQYTTDANLMLELPPNLPPGLDSSEERLAYIEQASALTDALVGPDFPAGLTGQRFANMTDDPPTPPIVELATRKLAASLIYGALHVVNGGGGRDARDTLATEALEWFRRIREREIAVTGDDRAEVAMSRAASSTTRQSEPVFRIGRYHFDGSLMDETDGSLDDF